MNLYVFRSDRIETRVVAPSEEDARKQAVSHAKEAGLDSAVWQTARLAHVQVLVQGKGRHPRVYVIQ